MSAAPTPPVPRPLHRTVWRWHFYAGLFCVPFVLWLASTGSIYLFKPQIEAWIDRPLDRLTFDGPLAAPSAQVQAALATVPGAGFSAYELPQGPASAARVLLRAADGTTIRAYVDPARLTVLRTIAEEDRLLPTIARLHGKLGIGDPGSYVVELAASWAIVMIVTGLYLWWPRDGSGPAGVLWLRFTRRGRPLWRDLHAVIGFWASAFALFLLITGLPWTAFWGSNLRALRSYAAQADVRQDWTTRAAATTGHEGHGAAAVALGYDAAVLDRLLPVVVAAALAPPVLITAPSAKSPHWLAKSDSANRPQRVTLTFDGETGQVLKREGFDGKPLFDRIISTGIAAHEGQLFGLGNQLLGLFTALSLIGLCISAVVMWLKRRPPAVLGAPTAIKAARVPVALIVAAITLALLLPMFGLSLIAVLIVERVLLRRLPRTREFLGLAAR